MWIGLPPCWWAWMLRNSRTEIMHYLFARDLRCVAAYVRRRTQVCSITPRSPTPLHLPLASLTSSCSLGLGITHAPHRHGLRGLLPRRPTTRYPSISTISSFAPVSLLFLIVVLVLAQKFLDRL